MLQLLSSSQLQAETQINAASQMIQEYGQAVILKDARLALEYYWQAAAVLGGTTSVKVLATPSAALFMCDPHHVTASATLLWPSELSLPLLHCLSMTPHHVTARAELLCSAVLSFGTFICQQMSACTKPAMSCGVTDLGSPVLYLASL